MQKTLMIKLSIIGGLCLLFAIGLSLIQSMVYERQQYSDTVIREISSQHVNPQEVITPFIAVPTTITPACKVSDPQKCPKSYKTTTPQFPKSTEAAQSLAVSTDTYKRGIYHATSYQGQLNFKQQYNLANTKPNSATTKTEAAEQTVSLNATATPNPAPDSAQTPSSTTATSIFADNSYYERDKRIDYDWQDARLIIPVSDLRGVAQLPTVKVNGQVMSANYPATPQMAGLSYVEVVLPSNLAQQPNLQLSIELPLMGLSAVRTVPLGQQFSLSMDSDWHAPNFIGQALPAQKSFDTQGFKATWENQYLTVANNQMMIKCLTRPSSACDIQANLAATSMQNGTDAMRQAEIAVVDAVSNSNIRQTVQLNGFGVSFAEPNDVYLQTERTMKYALLLIMVSFGTFFLFEIIKSLRIHPIQYLLVGSALLVFYVLLLPLAEQIVFWQAYVIAATACVGLIGWYTYYVLVSVKRAAIFTAILGGLYAGFFGILTTEDMNLLLGAIFCFVLLASVMYLTRKIDWYQIA